eukprot:COSAG06_NODE_15529_length_1064_cov_1.131606_2_plen_267_part_01
MTESVRYLQSIHVDGVNFDTEYCCKDATSNRGQAYLFRRLSDALHDAIPGSKVSVTTASLHLGPAPHDPTYLPLANSVDYLVPMEYDSGASLYGGHSTPSGYQGGYYTACAQMALSLVKYGIDNYNRAGVPATKLVLAFPFYGYVFNCADNVTTFQHGPNQGCHMGASVPWENGGRGGTTHWPVTYDSKIDQTFETCVPPAWWLPTLNESIPSEGPLRACSILGLSEHAMDGIHWDEGSQTPWFRYVAQYVQTPCGPPEPPNAPPTI